MKRVAPLVVFYLEEQRYALYLDVVERILPALEITALPGAPAIVRGVINLHGQLIPVADIRKRLRLPSRDMELDNHVIVARTASRFLAMVVDSVSGVVEFPECQLVPAQEIASNVEYVEGLVKLEDGLVLIHDPETFLSLDEQKALETALTD